VEGEGGSRWREGGREGGGGVRGRWVEGEGGREEGSRLEGEGGRRQVTCCNLFPLSD
jgi:hypothetical protein